MENYLNKFDTFTNTIVYIFEDHKVIQNGGIGDYIKYFVYLLQICIKKNIKLYYLIDNNLYEKFLKLKYKKLYIKKRKIGKAKSIKKYRQLFNFNKCKKHKVSPWILWGRNIDF